MARLFRKIALALAVAGCAIALCASSAAASGTALIYDCNADGTIDGHYSAGDMKYALSHLPADVDQYSTCRSVIQQALLNKVSKPGAHGSKPNAKVLNAVTTASQRRQAAASAQARASKSLPPSGAVAKLGNADVRRSGARTLASSAAPGIPATLLVAVAGLLLLLGGELAGRAIGKSGRGRGESDRSGR